MRHLLSGRSGQRHFVGGVAEGLERIGLLGASCGGNGRDCFPWRASGGHYRAFLGRG